MNDTRKNLHLAIVDENDEYMGTVSLKNIEEDKAEFAITVRKNARLFIKMWGNTLVPVTNVVKIAST